MTVEEIPDVEVARHEREAVPRRAGRRWLARLPWLLVVITTCAAVVFATLWAPLYLEVRDRERVRAAATELVLHLTTFEGETIEEWVAQTQSMATGNYAGQVNELFDQTLRDALRAAEAQSVGTLVNLFVQDIQGDEAVAFAVARQTIRNSATTTPVEDELRIQIELRREGGRWLASNVEVLGPSGIAPPVTGGNGSTETEGQDG